MCNSENSLSKILNSPLTVGIALIVIGILFCALRAGFISILLTIVGVVLIILGILNLVGRNWTMGGIELAVGAVIIICGWLIVDITLLLLGIVFIAYSIYQIATTAPKLKRAKFGDIIMSLLYPLLMLTIGIILVVAKWQMIDVIFIIIGEISIVTGIIIIAKNIVDTNKATAVQSPSSENKSKSEQK